MCAVQTASACLRFAAVATRRGIPKRTPEQKAEVGAFINQLYELSGADSDVDFASRAGLWSSNVGEYLKGKTMPDAYTLLRLMVSVDLRFTAKGNALDLPALAEVPAAAGGRMTVSDRDRLARLEVALERALLALDAAGIELPDAPEATRFDPTEPRSRPARDGTDG